MASRMSPASLQSDLPLNSKPWVEALTGGEAAAETTAHSHWVSPVPTNPAVRPSGRASGPSLTLATRSKRRSNARTQHGQTE
jgi:hypothetical protein